MALAESLRAHLIVHRSEARERLLSWFASQARDLPWRRERTPYRVWVSEIMLQQTQVETVRDYFLRFMARFPTLHSLAEASLQDVLKLWEGLGYYSRARSLHRAAREIVAVYGGGLPADVQALRALPGIGPYTAGAIASLAFGIPAPAVDGNVRRVMARVLALETPSPATLETAVCVLLPEEAPGIFNEALIELGATVCRPQTPQCLLCPWRDFCLGRQEGEPAHYPAPKPRKVIPHYDVAAAVTVRDDGRVLVAQRRHDDMLGGLWEYPGGKRQDGETLEVALRRELKEEMDILVDVGVHLTRLKHAYTHFRITLHAFRCRLAEGTPRCLECDDFMWADLATLHALPMAATDRKITQVVAAMLDAEQTGADRA
ncbi:MAG: A/G-specific adenine glycosylase [Anaerolineae bacterium]|nr:A/G-specific adenine glycosylase [Anaerolineae bacterium]